MQSFEATAVESSLVLTVCIQNILNTAQSVTRQREGWWLQKIPQAINPGLAHASNDFLSKYFTQQGDGNSLFQPKQLYSRAVFLSMCLGVLGLPEIFSGTQ